MIWPIGKFGPGVDSRDIEEVPSDYLRWLQGEEWTYEKHPEEMEEVDFVMQERTDAETHWSEEQEEAFS